MFIPSQHHHDFGSTIHQNTNTNKTAIQIQRNTRTKTTTKKFIGKTHRKVSVVCFATCCMNRRILRASCVSCSICSRETPLLLPDRDWLNRSSPLFARDGWSPFSAGLNVLVLRVSLTKAVGFFHSRLFLWINHQPEPPSKNKRCEKKKIIKIKKKKKRKKLYTKLFFKKRQ